MDKDFPFVDAHHLESTVRRSLWVERIFFWLAIIATGWVAWHWWNEFLSTVPWLGLCLFLIFFLWHLPVFSAIPVNDATANLLGQYSREDLERILREVCRSYDEREIPKVYIVDNKRAGAWVVNVDILNFIGPWNALYLSPYILHCTSERELKTILAHEMCHFSLHYTIGSRFFYLRQLGWAIWMTTLISYPLRWWENFIGDGWLFWIGLIFLTIIGLSRFVFKVSDIISKLVWIFSKRLDSHEVEALCDLEAARRFGMTPTCNMLLKIGTREEIFDSVAAAFSAKPNKPIDHNSPLYSEKGAITIAINKLEEVLPAGFVSLEEAEPYIEESVQEGVNATQSKCFYHTAKNLLRWQSYDNRVRDLQLDTQELGPFLADLKQHSDRPLFDSPEEVYPELHQNPTHPNIRNRILFLAHNMVEEKVVERRENINPIPAPNIYLARGKERNGLYSKERIRQFLSNGQLDGTELAWHEGCNGWVNVMKILNDEASSI